MEMVYLCVCFTQSSFELSLISPFCLPQRPPVLQIPCKTIRLECFVDCCTDTHKQHEGIRSVTDDFGEEGHENLVKGGIGADVAIGMVYCNC